MRKAKTVNKKVKPVKTRIITPNLFKDVKSLIEKTRVQAAYNINSSLVILNWNIGKRIQEEVLKNKRAEYGSQIVATLAQQFSWSHIIEFLTIKDNQLEKSNIKVAEYLTALPPKKLLERKLHQAVVSAQKKFNLK